MKTKPEEENKQATSSGLDDPACSALWVFECPICGKTVRAEETERHLKDHSDALREAEILLGEIMRGEVNPEDESEKWIRAFAPQFFRQNA